MSTATTARPTGVRRQPSQAPAAAPARGGAGQFVTRDEFQKGLEDLKKTLTDALQSVFGDAFGVAAPPAAPAPARRPARAPEPEPEAESDVAFREPDAEPEVTVRPAGRTRAGSVAPPLAAPGDPAVPICGKSGDVKVGADSLPEITKWSFKPSVAVQEYASNKSNGFKRKVCGVKSGSGSIEGKWNINDPITDHFVEGDYVTLLLHLDSTRLVTVTALIKSFDLEVDINDNQIEGWSAEFDADGEWTYTIAAAP